MKSLFRIFVSALFILTVLIPGNLQYVESGTFHTNHNSMQVEQDREGITTIRKVVDKTVANPGDTLTYSIDNIGYSGSELLSNVTVTDQIPVGTSYVAGSAQPVATDNNGLLTWNIGTSTNKIIGQTGNSSEVISLLGSAGFTTINNNNLLSINGFTTLPGVNRLMLVGISWSRTDIGDDSRTITSVTFIGTELTQIGVSHNDQYRDVAIYYLIAPPESTSGDIKITFSGVVNAVAGAIIFSGVDQTNPIRTYSGATGDSGAPSVDVETLANDYVLATVVHDRNSALNITGTGQLSHWYTNSGTGTYQVRGAGSSEKATSTLTTMSWNVTSSGTNNDWAIGAVAIKPASTPPTRTTTVTAYPTLISSGDSFTLKAVITNTEDDNEVIPGIPTSITTGGASVLCGAPTPLSGSIAAGGSLEFTWTCTATADPSSFGSVALSVDADSGYYATGKSNSVLVVPSLSYQVSINSNPTISRVINTASIQGDGGIATTASTAITDILALGNLVWEDDGDGIQEGAEPGVASVAVTLYTSEGSQVAQTLTNSSGNYSFTGLTAGSSYYLYFGLPEGYIFTSKDQGDDDALDSDADPLTGQTGTFIWVGTTPDLSRDAGLRWVYVSKTDRTVTAAPDPVSPCCQEYLVSQTVSASEAPGGITTPATNLTLSDTLASEFSIVPESITGCEGANISTDGKTLTCSWPEQASGATTTITYRIRKVSAAAISTSGAYPTHVGGSLQYTDHLGLPVMVNYGAGTTTAYLRSATECQGDIEIEKTLMTSPVSAGGEVMFRLEISNLSTFPISGFTITDKLDPLLSFVSAQPSICSYDGRAGVDYGRTVTCTVAEVIDGLESFTLDLATLFMPGITEFFGENTAYVSCPWCIVDSSSDSSVSPLAITGVINFGAFMNHDIVVSWETVDETLIRGFKLYRQSRDIGTLIVYETQANFPFQIMGSIYSFTDTSYQPGGIYQYFLETLWMDGTTTMLMTERINAPYRMYLPLMFKLTTWVR